MLSRIHSERHRRQSVSYEVDVENLSREEGQRKSEQEAEKNETHFRKSRQEKIHGRLPDVVKDDAAFLNGRNNRFKIAIEEHHVRHLLRHVRAVTLCNTDVGGLKRGRVVHPVAYHRDRLSTRT